MASYDSNSRRLRRYDDASSRSSDRLSDSASSSRRSSGTRRTDRSLSSRGRITVSLRDEAPASPRGSRPTYESQRRSRLQGAEEELPARDRRAAGAKAAPEGEPERSSRRRRREAEPEESRSRQDRSRRRSRSGESEDRRSDGRRSEGRRSEGRRSEGRSGGSGRQRGSQRDSRQREASGRRARQARGAQAAPAAAGIGGRAASAPGGLLSGRLVYIIGGLFVIVALFLIVTNVGSCIAGGLNHVKWGISTSADLHYDLRATDLSSLEKTKQITPVSFSPDEDSFSVTEDQVGAINDALYKVEKTAHCGFVLLDMQTGRALVYNPTEVMYCASAVKAPLCYYAVTHPAGGTTDENGVTTTTSGTSGLTDTERTQVENAIQWSSNNDYFALCETYFKEPYLQWIATYGVKYNAEQDGNFPSMSAASLGALWVEIYQYISGSSSDAKWLNGLFEKTEQSFIRDGLKDEKVTVREKAGWISDGETDAVTDAGIITKDDRNYLMVIVTGSRDTDKGHKNVADLAASLFAARGLLAPNISLTC